MGYNQFGQNTSQGFAPPSAPGVPKGYCFSFHLPHLRCARPRCNFKHTCYMCSRGEHAAFLCRNVRPAMFQQPMLQQPMFQQPMFQQPMYQQQPQYRQYTNAGTGSDAKQSAQGPRQQYTPTNSFRPTGNPRVSQ